MAQMPVRTFLAAFASLLLTACATISHPPVSQASGVEAKGLVSAADPRAAEAGAEILRKGGNATDAAIATMLALTVVEPQSSGIGGGGFLVRATGQGEVETIDGRETAPVAAAPDWFLDDEGKPLAFRATVESGLSVGVPGNIALAGEAHRRFGRLAWAELFGPAIRLAREGWTLSGRFRGFLFRDRSTAGADGPGRSLFYQADGTPKPEGTLLRNPELATTLERIAADGPASFYTAPSATILAEKVRARTPRPSGMTAADLAAYRPVMRPAVCGRYRLYRICGMGPPGSGATTILAVLGQLERFDLAALGKDSPVFWHLFAESQRLAYADRERFLADPDHIAVPVVQLLEPKYLAKRSALIDPARTMPVVEPGLDMPPPDGMEPPERGTSHFVAVDRDGAVVSYTSTIESAFGSGIMTGGFYLNNELTDFSFVPAINGEPVANRVESGKRPRSSMAPTVVHDPAGQLVLAVGAAGGATIPVQVSKILIGVIDFRLPLNQAMALPVLFSPTDTVMVEQGSALEALMPALRALGHSKVEARALPLKANAAILTRAGWQGAADPRSEGAAVSQ